MDGANNHSIWFAAIWRRNTCIWWTTVAAVSRETYRRPVQIWMTVMHQGIVNWWMKLSEIKSKLLSSHSSFSFKDSNFSFDTKQQSDDNTNLSFSISQWFTSNRSLDTHWGYGCQLSSGGICTLDVISRSIVFFCLSQTSKCQNENKWKQLPQAFCCFFLCMCAYAWLCVCVTLCLLHNVRHLTSLL